MPSFACQEDKRIAEAMERWSRVAQDEVEEIGLCRENPATKGFPQSLYGGNGEPSLFFESTGSIVGWIARQLPSLNPAPLQDVYGAVNAWYSDNGASRLPVQPALEGTLAQAMLLLTAAWEEICSRMLKEPKHENVDGDVAAEFPDSWRLKMSGRNWALLCALSSGKPTSFTQLHNAVWADKPVQDDAVNKALQRLDEKILADGYTIVIQRSHAQLRRPGDK